MSDRLLSELNYANKEISILKLNHKLCEDQYWIKHKENEKLKADNEKLEKKVFEYCAMEVIKNHFADENIKLKAENERLHQFHRDIYEVWAGSEGIGKPATAREAYIIQLIEEMRDISSEGLKDKE